MIFCVRCRLIPEFALLCQRNFIEADVQVRRMEKGQRHDSIHRDYSPSAPPEKPKLLVELRLRHLYDEVRPEACGVQTMTADPYPQTDRSRCL